MKKLFFFLALLCATTIFAQQPTIDSNQQVTAMSDSLSSTSTCPYLDIDHGKYFLDNKSITSKEYKDFLKNNSPEAWQSYKKGTALWATGWSLAGVGVACIFAGELLLIGDAAAGLFESGHGPGVLAGLGLMIGGGALNIASIPCLIVGGKKKFSAHEIYNRNCTKQPQVQLSLQTSQNGLGLALKF
ncbi:MAG: hypothetical protein E7074_08375 [Bacteroidales bacterium]|jgi:hypothetical protein|nr:hypothetical protein [Bacteroidales bacterium]